MLAKRQKKYKSNFDKRKEAEEELDKILVGQKKPTIILRAEVGVPIEDAVFIMDIATKKNYKVVLAVRPN